MLLPRRGVKGNSRVPQSRLARGFHQLAERVLEQLAPVDQLLLALDAGLAEVRVQALRPRVDRVGERLDHGLVDLARRRSGHRSVELGLCEQASRRHRRGDRSVELVLREQASLSSSRRLGDLLVLHPLDVASGTGVERVVSAVGHGDARVERHLLEDLAIFEQARVLRLGPVKPVLQRIGLDRGSVAHPRTDARGLRRSREVGHAGSGDLLDNCVEDLRLSGDRGRGVIDQLGDHLVERVAGAPGTDVEDVVVLITCDRLRCGQAEASCGHDILLSWP